MRYFCGLFVFCAHFATAAVNDASSVAVSCRVALNNSPLIRLGIGALGETADGHQFLGILPYVGSLHNRIVSRLSHDLHATKIIWMGEMRYVRSEDDRILIVEANETSGAYYNHIEGEERLPIQEVQNDVRRLPESILAAGFHAIPFDPDHQRLVPEVEKLVDVRHDLNNIFQVLQGAFDLFVSPRLSLAERQKKLDHSLTVLGPRVSLFRWLLLHLLEQKQVTAENVSELISYVNAIDNTLHETSSRLTRILELDADKVRDQFENLNTLLNSRDSELQVEIIKVH